MKYTSEMLMKDMKLQVGDKIKFYNEVFTIVEMPNNIGIENDTGLYNIDILLNKDFEILPRPKRVGDLKCSKFGNCSEECPLYWLNCDCHREATLYEALEDWFDNSKDQEIYDLIKARLDKEVSE